MTVRTIRVVERGEQLTTNYIGLYENVYQRRKQLIIEKSFFCNCRRCTLTPANQHELDKFKQEQFLDAVKCQQKHGKSNKHNICSIHEMCIDKTTTIVVCQ
jgi:hypothetical protein